MALYLYATAWALSVVPAPVEEAPTPAQCWARLGGRRTRFVSTNIVSELFTQRIQREEPPEP